MTYEELFLSEGAEYFGNRLIYRNRDVGHKAPGGDLVLTPEGVDVHARLANITDVVAKDKSSSENSSGIDELLANLDD